jgi:hypothetical protein
MTTCSATLASGEPCNAPAINNRNSCRHHDPNRPHKQAQSRSRESQPLELPPLVNKNGVLSAIVEVIHAISERRVKRSEGGTLLFGLQMASSIMTELDQMAPPYPDEEYDSNPAHPVVEANSPELIEKLEQRRKRLQEAGNNSYVPTAKEMTGFMSNFECANAKKLVESIAARRNAWETERANSSKLSGTPSTPHSNAVGIAQQQRPACGNNSNS